MTKPNNRVRVGDVFQITLPNDKFVYGCVMRDACVGIYQGVFKRSVTPDFASTPFAFVAGVYSNVPGSDQCPVVAHYDFPSVDDEWPPPQWCPDLSTGGFQIYHRGKFSPASKADIEGMDLASVYELEHLIQRIMKAELSGG